ncbi:phosphoglycerate dehydrogenase [Brachybacterium sp. p3-SID1565]|uniref:D-3-phosphoglycerate dehydrogenase n=1 Tax=Brachybacterium epidermidis TaxID=2781983 RepID=A0ABR9VY61_9MICO|nr:phosphoglycerate dehydrogenase [Brachybacterium sp. p3-SID1565]MBE9403130.1 phosphoglycerate dehydrogenase [Brachybacterium epidermidis]MCT1386403.1 phosphoglycerate dehydrogenase [Brachybacterium sp. p3-SID1565]
MTRPVVLIAEELSPATVEVLGPDVEVRSVDGTDRSALLTAVAQADALLVRSATLVDAEVYAAAPKLRVVARAGVGLDNVDVPAATAAGVMVINAPTSNIVSAAELAVTLILASLRNLGRADASMKQGKWERKALTGTELLGKTVGVVGFGRIGQLVAERLAPFGVHLLAYDPYVNHTRAAELGARVVELDELMRESDVVTVHMPKTPETTGLIGAEQLAMAKPTLHVVNAARGGLIDEHALVEALTSGRIAGAALDVYSSEPPSASPSAAKLLELDNVTLTPHLGASTAEAQEKAGTAVAQSVRLALAGELVPDAVNVAGGAIDDLVRPGVALADRLGQLFTVMAGEAPELLDIVIRGEIASRDVTALKLSVLRGVFRSVVTEQVSYVNAPVLAEERGITVNLETHEGTERFRNEIQVRGTLRDGEVVSVSGTLSGVDQIHKLIEVAGHPLDVTLSDHLMMIRYEDRPGQIGQYGALLGEAGVNIAGMQVSRAGDGPGAEALVILNLDQSAPRELAERIGEAIGARAIHTVDIAY